MARHDVLGWAVLCGTAGVMLGSALIAEPPVPRTDLHRAGMFPIDLTLAGGGPAMATTSYALRGDGGPHEGVRHGCIVVPSSAERNGGEVRLSVRAPVGSESQLLITVDRGSGSDADCHDFEPSELVHRGTTDTVARRYPRDAGLAVADADDGELTIRVGIEPIDAGASGAAPAGGTTWLDVEHRLSADR